MFEQERLSEASASASASASRASRTEGSAEQSRAAPNGADTFTPETYERFRSQVRVPKFDGTTITLKQYRRKVMVWEHTTEIPASKRGLTLYSELEGRAQKYLEEIDLEPLMEAGGVAALLAALELKFPEIQVHDTWQLSRQFVKPALFRTKGEEILDYNNRFDGVVE